MKKLKRRIEIGFAALILFSLQIFAQPTLLTPVNGQTGISVEPTFTWSETTNSYKLEVDDNSDFSSPLIQEAITTDESYSISSTLDNSTTYYWRVSDDDWTSWNDASFTTIAAVSIIIGHPAGGTVYTNATTFSWYPATTSTNLKYKVQVTSAESGGNADWTQTPDFETTTTNTYTSFTLLGGKTYFWRIIVLSSGNDVISYSATTSFETAGGIEPVYLSYPIDLVTVYTNAPTFYWYLMSPGTDITFDLQVDEDSNFGSPEIDEQNISALNYESTIDLSAGTTYYWRVKPYYKRGTGDVVEGSWTAYEDFETHGTGTVLQPYLSYPIDGVTIYSTSPYLYWYVEGASTGLTFDVYYKTSAGSYPGTPNVSTTNLYAQVTGLTQGESYTWKVVAKNNGNTLTSTEKSFEVFSSVSAGHPVATWPVDGPTMYTAKPTLLWYLEGSSTGLTKYTVKWKKGSNSNDGWQTNFSGTTDITNLFQTYFTFSSDLIYGETYYWAVASFDGSSYSAYSEGHFTIVGGSTVTPILSYPADGDVISSTSVLLGWYLNGSSTGIQSYEVHYSTDGFLSTDNVISPNPTANSVTLSSLTPGATYSWKVRAFYGGSTYSAYSNTQTFIVAPGASPVQPLIGGPNNIVINTNAPNISWAIPINSESPLTYEMEISQNSDMSNAQVYSDIPNSFVTPDQLEVGKEYYWRVKSKNNSGDFSIYSAPAKFAINNTTAIKNDDILVKDYKLYQNYPNPFNPSTVIKYQIPDNVYVEIGVYDLLGSRVGTLVKEFQNSGNYSIEFDGSKYPSGVYLYRITAGEFTSVNKMMLIK